MQGIAVSLVALALLAVVPAAPDTWDLQPQTLAAFDRYAKLTEARMANELGGKSAFLWLDRQPPPQRAEFDAQLRRGEVVVAKLETRDGGREIDTPDGMLHHWIGTVLLPKVTLDRVVTFVQDYAKYPAIFDPMIARSKIVSRTGNTFLVQMRTVAEKVITVTLDGDYTVEYRSIAPEKMFTRSVAQNFFEVSSPGTASESRTAAEKGAGYLWRLNTYCSFEQRSNGVYEQCETISLTRDIPFLVRPIVRPFVSSIPKETLEQTLGKVRAGLSK